MLFLQQQGSAGKKKEMSTSGHKMKSKRAAAFLFMATMIRGYRVVVLHGKGNSGESYRQRLQPLITAPQFKHVDWVFPTAPYRMKEGQEEFEWWRLPKGERSFTALSYDGAEESIQQIESMKDVDALIGHSQGAILMSVVLARRALGLSSFQTKHAILSGAAWPKPYEKIMNDLSSLPRGTIAIPTLTLHVIGAADDVNPTEQAAEICTLLQGQLLMHPGGHVLPLDDESIGKYASFLLSTK